MLRCYTAVKNSAIKFTTLLFFFGFINLLTAQSQHPSFEPLFIFNEKSPVYTADEVFELGLLLSECEKGSETWNHCNQKFKAIKKEVTSSAMKNLSDEEKNYVFSRIFLCESQSNEATLKLAQMANKIKVKGRK